MAAGQASVKLALVIVDASIASLKVAETRALLATPVTMGVLATGDVAVTVGTRPAPGVPRMGSRPPPPQPATSVASSITATPAALERLKILRRGFMVSSWQTGAWRNGRLASA